MSKTGKTIFGVLGIIICVALLIGKGSKVYQQHKEVESIKIQQALSELEFEQKREKEEQQKLEEERHASDAEYQVANLYYEYDNIMGCFEYDYDQLPISGKKECDELIAKLHEWIPKYRAELEEARTKALDENDISQLEYCDEKLSGLKEIEEEIAGICELYIIREEGKYGYINRTGTIVIEPQFESCLSFQANGLASVKVNGKWGCINKKGTIVIEPQSLCPIWFSNEIADVMIGDSWEHGKYGFIDKSGEFIIEPKFERAEDFSDGYAAVRNNDMWGFIDSTGEYVISPQFIEAHSFYGGLARVSIGNWRNSKWGFIDKDGVFVVNPQFDRVEGFSEGLAAVEIGNKWGFIDKDGVFIVNPQFDRSYGFSEGLAAVEIDNKWGFIDKKGTIVIDPQFDMVFGGFNNDEPVLVIVGGGEDYWENGKRGFINRNGEYVINPQFDRAENFFEGLAAVRVGDWRNGKWGFIDKNGVFIINPQFDEPPYDETRPHMRFRHGIAMVFKDDKMAYIDKTGNCVWREK